ncbi:hypothetical protein CBS147346_10690 [Aspergillus niger]|nr:hypothetical protein CBS147346_10690 [Aspergillus niger]
MANVAVVTGGVDRTTDGTAVAKRLNAMFVEADVSDYKSVFDAFSAVWGRYKRLNFVFANAGIIERQSFYSPPQGDHGGLVPTFDISTINVNLSGVIFTSHVALQFFRRGEDAGPKSIIMTSSSSGLYPNLSAPIYAASKHGIVGFMRSIAQRLYSQDGISVNCINPGTTRTGIIGTKEWNIFPADCISTPEQVATIVKSIIESSSFHGQAVEIVVDQTFPRGPPPFLDERMERLTACADRLIG